MKNKAKNKKKSVQKKTVTRGAKARKAPARTKAVRKVSLRAQVQQGLEAIANSVSELFTSTPKDLVAAIMKDHDGLRQFIGVLKDTKRDMSERRKAFELFSALLKSHTIAEEKAVYKPMEEKAKHDLVIRIEEGYVEHSVADKVLADMEKATDPNVWSAHANVLAELVEHHLKEEEDEMFPMMKKQIPKALEPELMIEFLELRGATQSKVTPKNEGVLEVLR